MAASAALDEPLASVDQAGLNTWTICAVPVALSLHLSVFHRQAVVSRPWLLVLPALPAGACFLWLSAMARIVPEPYLDEVFHIPQAQKYCDGKFGEWDDKITTPPGLYLLSVVLPQAAGRIGLAWTHGCDASSLRVVNMVGLFVVAYLGLLCRHQMEAQMHDLVPPARRESFSEYSLHTALNLALFPLLFFFSGLYYTDVVSTAVVVGAFLNHLDRVGRHRSSLLSDMLTIGLGLLALLMRQTNVFWVVVYMGGLEAVHAIKTLRPERVDAPTMTTLRQQLEYSAWRFSVGDVHDEALSQAWPDDMLLTAMGLVIAAMCNAGRVLRQVWPYATVLAAFAAFVAWNGGVVLGDKSNHVATIHLAQMLYIWPFFAFFSWPLLLPYAMFVATAITLRRANSSSSTAISSSRDSRNTGGSKSKQASGDDSQDMSIALWIARQSRPLLRPVYVLGTFLLSCTVVRYNTIIHPFTLADNRHYMFYVFRYTIRRAAWIRYLLVLPYTASRWLVWGTMAGSTYDRGNGQTETRCSEGKPRQRAQKTSETEARVSQSMPHEAQERHSPERVSTSTGLMFLLATTLSLVTAPLVEPRYFIVPWVMWRLLVPTWLLRDDRTLDGMLEGVDCRSRLGKVVGLARRHDLRLVLETVWFLAINLVTCSIFITKPFVWRAEDGRVLDSGRLQRFMW